MQNKFNFSRLRFFIILLVLSVILFFFRELKPVNQVFFFISKPLFQITNNIKYSITNMSLYFRTQKHLIKENRLLKKENMYLKRINSVLLEKNIEYKKIAELLELSDFSGSKSINAKVIGRNTSQWFNAIIINKGKRDGVKKHVPVIAGESLIGRVEDVYFNSSRIILITDSRFKVSAILQDERMLGIIRGDSTNFLQFEFEYHKENISDPGIEQLLNQTVITSGFDEFIIKGIKIGKITSIKENEGIIKKVRVSPAADLDKLEFVQVLVPLKSPAEENVK